MKKFGVASPRIIKAMLRIDFLPLLCYNTQRGGDEMKTIRIILWIIICIIFLLGVLYLFTGSLEWFPTPDQQEKSQITSIIMMVIPVISGIILFLTRKK